MRFRCTTASLTAITLLTSLLPMSSSALPILGSTKQVKPAAPKSCQSLIQEYLDWKKAIDNKGGVVIKGTNYSATIYATLVYHYPDEGFSLPNQYNSNAVWYGIGPVNNDSQNFLLGNLDVWTNRISPSTTGGPFFFKPTTIYQVKISPTGFITSTKLLNGKPVGGISPSESYQATCTSGVFTGISSNGIGTYTLSLRKQLTVIVPK